LIPIITLFKNCSYAKSSADYICIYQHYITVSRGAIYTRWGRPDCPSNGTTLVYTGMNQCIVLTYR
jgi:hypothetical protein